MKKGISIFISLLLSIMLVFSIAGCGADSQNDLQAKIDELQSQIEELNDQLKKRDERIEQLEKEREDLIDGMQDFVLKISANKQVYGSKDKIHIDATLENRSGENQYIAYYRFLYPECSTGDFSALEKTDEARKMRRSLDNEKSIREIDDLGGCFPVGQHKLRYRAVFFLDAENEDSVVEVWSNAIEFTVEKAQDSDGVPDGLAAKMQESIFTISADKQVYRRNEEIWIDITLENRSGADVEITSYSLFVPYSLTGQFPVTSELPDKPATSIFKNGEVIHVTRRLGGCFPVGQHELKYSAGFYLGWDTIDETEIFIWSNTIEFEVVEA